MAADASSETAKTTTSTVSSSSSSSSSASESEVTAKLTASVVTQSSESTTAIKPGCVIDEAFPDLVFRNYSGEEMMADIQELCAANLSEPYSVFTFRYFVNNWPNLTYLAMRGSDCVGLIICRLRTNSMRRKIGYIAMLVVDKSLRRRGLGTKMVQMCVSQMISEEAYECNLETEIDNYGALKLYQSLGFVKEVKYRNYYFNGNDAYRLTLHLHSP